MQVIYDIMVCAVGETTATFGVPGVMEHCYFMKASFLTPRDSQSCCSLSRLTLCGGSITASNHTGCQNWATSCSLPGTQGNLSLSDSSILCGDSNVWLCARSHGHGGP